MRRTPRVHGPVLALTALLGAVPFVPLRAQDADDAKRGVARLSLIEGDVSVQRGDSGELVAAAVNAPLTAQDRILTGPSSRAEIQIDSASVMRLGANAEVGMAELEYRRAILQMARGTATFRVLRDSTADIEVDTPNVSVRPSRQGTYRITVHENGQTEVTVRAGDVEIFTPHGTEQVHNGQTLIARGTASDPEIQLVNAGLHDDWDRWNDTRDQTFARSASPRYVSPDVYGTQDLDTKGQWVYDAPYGYVWRPAVAAGWAPYQAGRWVWLDWYGWTWVSYEPWGWAPYHYGRWYYGARGWCWYPGAVAARYYWSPALVGFFGFGAGAGVRISVGWGNVGWVPLAPYERLSPWWGRSYYSSYHTGAYLDKSVNVIQNVNVTNIYRNARVANGVTAVNAADFSLGRFNTHARYTTADLSQTSVVRGPVPAAPGAAHMQFSDRPVSDLAASRAANPGFFAHRQPNTVERVPLAQQQQSLARISRIPVEQRFAAGGVNANPAGAPAQHAAGYSPAVNAGNSLGSGAQPSTLPTIHGNETPGAGWSRLGGATGGPHSAGDQPAPRVSASPGAGWRRLSDTTGTTGRTQAAPANPAARGGDTGSGWQHFGDPAATAPRFAEPQLANPGTGNAGSSTSAVRGWNRFGDPSAAPHENGTPRVAAPQAQYVNQRSQPTFSPSPAQRTAAPRQESIRMSAPVVRERSAAPPRSSGGGSGSGGGSHGGAPQGGSGAHHGGHNR